MKRLTEFSEGIKVKIKDLRINKTDTLNLRNLGISKGITVKIVRKSNFKGPVIIYYRNTEVAIGYTIAKKIFAESA